MGGIRDELDRIGEEVRERFDAQKRVLSFWEYLELLGEHPFRHTRDASRYVRDCFDHYGRSAIERPWGPIDRFRLFDLPFLDEADAPEPSGPQSERLVGQEEIQHAVYRILEDFVREGRANRLILLHGPNGSAKSTLTRCVMRGLEHYSSLDEGALYRFSWVFPRGSDSGGIGFGSRGDHPKAGESYAHLPDERIDVKVPSALREHPLLLLPRADRERLVRKLFAAGEIADAPPGWVARAQLGHMSRQIYEALLTAYRGDFERVLAHVQVERWYISRRYRSGAVMIGPQMAVDASERQITADRTLGSLPASLSAVTLFEPYGELVDAAGGLIEYSDLLKRPLDAWKYLLLAIENGEVALSFSNLPLNLVMVASSNELHLAAFKEHPEYKSFRGRLHLVRVPYLLDYTREQEIYDGQIIPRIRRHVGPHTTYVAALWSVLTRLERANPERYADVAVGRLAASLTPLEKAEIYATGALPSRLSAAEAKTLLLGLEAIRAETADAPVYEGLIGASAREIRTIMLEAAADPEQPCVSPVAVLERIEAFCRRDDFDFLRQEPKHGYGDPRGFVAIVRRCWLDRVDDELRRATGLIDETQYRELFGRYVTHVSFWLKKERVQNRLTGEYEDADAELMSSVEEMIGVEDADGFRRDLIGKVAAQAIDHPGAPLDHAALFPALLEKVRGHYFAKHRETIAKIARDALRLLEDGAGLEPERRQRAEAMLQDLEQDYGYQPCSARIALGELVADRYPG